MHKDPIYLISYGVLLALALATAYVWFTIGDAGSLTRHLFKDPAADVPLLYGLSISMFLMGFFVFFLRDQSRYRALVEANAEKIRELRARNMEDDAIADAMLKALGSERGYRHRLARKKILALLRRFR